MSDISPRGLGQTQTWEETGQTNRVLDGLRLRQEIAPAGMGMSEECPPFVHDAIGGLLRQMPEKSSFLLFISSSSVSAFRKTSVGSFS
jgi:hypothetical protein